MTVKYQGLMINGMSIAARAILAGTFLWACIHKIAFPGDFALQVATYQLLPLYLVNMQAIVLPWVELLCAISLIAGFWTRASALVTVGMNIMFIVAIIWALNLDLHLQCGCFASSQAGEEMDAGLIIRDIGLLALGLFLVFSRPDKLTLDHRLNKRRGNEL